ncbi:hypothetical protein FRC17_009370 [Serendipita sp. 399]|nr:hypothetical protein FRC17_009370 [Serendipita sp. 399]
MLTSLGILQVNYWPKLHYLQSMLAVAAPSEDNWKSQSSSMSRPPIPSSSVTTSVTSTSPTAIRDAYGHPQSAPVQTMGNHNANGTIVLPHSGQANGTAQKPLVRSKSRGASMGGFVHGIMNGMQASLRNVGHKASHTVPGSGYHSDHPPPSKTGLFKSRSSISPTRADSPESSISEKTREQPSPVKAFNKALARSQSRSRAYESEGDNHTIGSLRQSRPSFPTISTTERVSKANGHTHIPLSPLSRESTQVQSPSAIATALGSFKEGKPSSPATSVTSSHSIRGPVSRGAAREILELDAIPPQDILKALAALLEQIATANDALRVERTARGEDPWDDQLSNIPKQGTSTTSEHDPSLSPESPKTPLSARSRSQQRAKSETGSLNLPIWDQLTSASRVALSSRSSSLSFHARHIPQISLEAYLMRILKYCPTANSTFVAVLAYFDRMCLLADNIETERQVVMKPSPLSSNHSPPDGNAVESPSYKKRPPFAIDSYNVHRLVIAGVTVASKFFSDIFYTNSRYAKVGGLPQAELNQLELQFLLLNDFQLVVPPEELARYAAQLIKYAQGRGMSLKPENLGKGKLGREAKIVLGLMPEPEPEPIPTGPVSPSFTNGYHFMGSPERSQGLGYDRGRYSYGRVPMAYPSNEHFHASRLSADGMDFSHDSETEVSTDEDSTIKARSGSESEASEWGVGSTGDEGEGDGAETETEGEDENDEEYHDRRNGRRLSSSSNGSHNRIGRLRGMPSADMNRRQT